MQSLKITILFYEDHEGKEITHDVVVDQVAEALTKKEHSVQLLGIHDSLPQMLDGLEKQQPDLVFNLVETFAGVDRFDTNITALLEMAGYRFTGADALGLQLTGDKVLTKKILKFHGIGFPEFMLVYPDEIEVAANMRLPLIVKPVRSDASVGIDDGSVVKDWKSFVQRVGYCHDELHSAALVEQFIEGREFFVAVLGHKTPTALPPVELDYSGMPGDKLKIYGQEAKFQPDSPEYKGTIARIATDLDDDEKGRLTEAAVLACQALRLQDYSRVDMRMSEEGDVYILEVNANPYLERSAEVAMAALQTGLYFEDLVLQIVESAWQRYETDEGRTALKQKRRQDGRRKTKDGGQTSNVKRQA